MSGFQSDNLSDYSSSGYGDQMKQDVSLKQRSVQSFFDVMAGGNGPRCSQESEEESEADDPSSLREFVVSDDATISHVSDSNSGK